MRLSDIFKKKDIEHEKLNIENSPLIKEYLENIEIMDAMTSDDFGNKKKVKETNKVADRNVDIARSIEEKYPELKEQFYMLLFSEKANVRRRVAHHMLERMSYDKKYRLKALREIEYVARHDIDSIERLGNSMWLEKWYEKHPEDSIFYNAFPKELINDLQEVLKVIPVKTSNNVVGYSENVYEYKQDDNLINIPYRIYYIDIEDENVNSLTDKQKMILYCIYTRHNNGYVREKYLKKILDCEFENWVIPFIVKLCDEYVVEILETIYEKLKDRNNDDIKEFCVNNKETMQKSYSRMGSYWNEYYRAKEYNFHKYIGRKLFRECLGYSRIFEYKSIHGLTKKNKTILESTKKCVCIYCSEKFDVTEIKFWIKDEKDWTARCPYCDVDSEIPQTFNNNEITNEDLENLYNYYF